MIEGMRNSGRSSLPRGVRGVDLGDAAVVFAREKLVLISKGTPEHVTLHFGIDSRILDIHRTSVAPDGSITYLTLFSITHENLALMMRELAPPIAEALTGLARPLNLRKMANRGVRAIVGLLPTGAKRAAVTRVRHARLSLDARKLVAQAWAPESLDELYGLEEGDIFTLFSCLRGRKPRKIGYGFPVTHGNRRRLIWVPDQRVAEAIERVGVLFQAAAARYGSSHVPVTKLA